MAERKARRKDREAFWRGMVLGQRHSGLSVRAYCRRHALHESAFYSWRRKLARGDDGSAGSAVAAQASFVPVRLSAAEESEDGAGRSRSERGRIEIHLGDGRQVHVVGVVDRSVLAEVLGVLAGGEAC